jgi:hypothetical protein
MRFCAIIIMRGVADGNTIEAIDVLAESATTSGPS